MAENTVNLRIPEEVRAVAGDPNRLRLTLIDLSSQIKDTITLGRGDPDLATPPHIVAAAEVAMRQQRTAPTPTAGLPELREAIAAKLRRVRLRAGCRARSPHHRYEAGARTQARE